MKWCCRMQRWSGGSVDVCEDGMGMVLGHKGYDWDRVGMVLGHIAMEWDTSG